MEDLTEKRQGCEVFTSQRNMFMEDLTEKR